MLSARFEAVSKEYADRQAFFGPVGEPVTFRSFFFTVAAFAEQLDDHGIEADDHVAVGVHDAIASTALRLALLRLGATIVPEPPSKGAGYRIDCRLTDRGETTLGPVPVIAVGQAWIRSPTRLIPVRAGGAMVTATSGTTGLPKLRRADEASLLTRMENGRRLRETDLSPALVGYDPSSTPGFANILRVLLSGGTVMLMEETPEATLASIARHGVRLAMIPAAKLPVLVAAAARIGPLTYALKRIQCGGGAISPSLAREAEETFGAPVINTYGTNETGSIAHFRPNLVPDEPGIVGEVYPHLTLRFLGPDDQERLPSEGGEIHVQVPPALRTHSFPDGAPVHDPDGWVGTGDIGRILPGGLLKLEGRLSDLINLGGNKRAPVLFEALLQTMTGLKEVAAFRIETPSGIDEVGVAVVADPAFDLEAARARLQAAHGAAIALHLIALDALPLTSAGKIDRRRLTALYSGQSRDVTA